MAPVPPLPHDDDDDSLIWIIVGGVFFVFGIVALIYFKVKRRYR
jgi:Mg2+ and Co2+ transporter CorA